ncbi:MAG: type I DNA topoisomerase, partial [Phycisphaerales bacterium]|nr:type I DNA topoisomerase [Phycisphaerales bacterium]
SSGRPQPPFTTSSLQQAASSQLYFAARRTMRIAQQLYEGIEIPGEGQVGLITYMRTDSRHLSADSVTAARSFIGEQHGTEYLPEKPNFYTSGKRAQEAHEAIRPTDPSRRPEDLKGCLNEEQFKLYNMIWKRFLACQMTPSRWNVTEMEIQIATSSATATYRATGRSLAFDGYLRVMGLPKDGDPILPELAEGNDVGAMSIRPTQHFTAPPSRFTEASLVKALEAEHIGRPSTYAAIIQTIQDRNYVEKLQRNFRPTDLGRVVVKKLIEGFPEIFNVKFTAHMEDELDEVEESKMNWVAVLKEFYGPFKAQLDVAAENMTHAKAETEPSDYKCPDCDSPMEYRFGKNGKFLSCTTYPECKKAMPIDREGKPVTDQFTDIACPLCGGPTTLRKGRFGPFISCKNYPECKGVVNLDKKGHIKHPAAPPLAIDLPCPKCEAPTMNVRRSKRGPWISCAKYPKCRGRGAFKSLDEAKQTEIETSLDAHIKANPMPRVHTLEGKDVGDEYTPTVIVETEDGTKTDA